MLYFLIGQMGSLRIYRCGYTGINMEQIWYIRFILLLVCLCLMAGPVAAYESAAVQDLKNSNPAQYNEYQSLMKKGDALMKEGKMMQAYDSYKQAMTIAPKDSAVLASMGSVYRAQGDNSGASDYYSRAETQAKLDNQYGDVGNKDYYDLMSKLSDERVRSAHNRLSLCKDDFCRITVQRQIDQYEKERADWNVKKAETEAGLPFPLFAVVAGLAGAAFLLARKRAQ